MKGKTGPIDLSEQQLIDCSGVSGTNGCNGGWTPDALKYITNNAIYSEANYPYVGYKKICSSPIYPP
jgi:hypothetical protein